MAKFPIKKKVTEVEESKEKSNVERVYVAAAPDSIEAAVERKLRSLFRLQLIDSKIDKLLMIRGELPLEVQDLEDDIARLETRIANFTTDIEELKESINERKNAIKECLSLIKKYEAQLLNVKNNREYDSLTKEVEYQKLEVQFCEKKIKDYSASLESKTNALEISQKEIDERKNDLEVKRSELDDIIAETNKEEEILRTKSETSQAEIDERNLTAYKRLRKNARNGLAIVVFERDSCGGCFNKIPPQRQLDIRMHKKVIACEYCGRVLVDDNLVADITV